MTEQPTAQYNQAEAKSWREERWELRQAHRATLGSPARGAAIIAGLLLVLLGIVFLLQTSGYLIIQLQNWGALFILIPILALFDRTYREYRRAGNQLTPQTRSVALVGLVLSVVMVVALFNLNWSIYGPVLIILVGLGLLSNTFLSNK